MQTVSYYKIGKTWYLDLPEWLEYGNHSAEDLEKVGAFCDFLEIASEGKDSVGFLMSENPFDGADVMHLNGESGDHSGAYYLLNTYLGSPINLELWFDKPFYHFFKTPPREIYFRVTVSTVNH